MRDEKKDDSRQPNRDSTWAWHKTIWKTVGWLLGESVIQAIEQAAKRHIGVIRWIGGLGGIAVGLGFLAGGLGRSDSP